MDEIGLLLAVVFVVGLATGYALRAAVSALKRRKAYQLRRMQAELEAAVSIEDLSRPDARSQFSRRDW